jgi:hypothetical protein
VFIVITPAPILQVIPQRSASPQRDVAIRHTRFADVCATYRYEHLYTIQYGKIGAGFIFRSRHSSPTTFYE